MSETQQTDQDVEVTETLDDVIAEYTPKPANPTAPVVQQQAAPVSIPQKVDPLDESSFNGFVEQISSGNSVLSKQLEEVRTQLTDFQQERATLQIEAEIDSAVGAINEGLELDPEIVRVHLELAAQKKPAFKNLWDNRKESPALFNKALKALSREIGSKYSVRQDPELTANQVAIRQSQQNMSTTNAKPEAGSLEDRLNNAKTDAEFDRIWQQEVSRGGGF